MPGRLSKHTRRGQQHLARGPQLRVLPNVVGSALLYEEDFVVAPLGQTLRLTPKNTEA